MTRNLFLLGAVSFFTDVASEMLYPLVPLFLTGALGASVRYAGLIEGLAEAAAAFLRIFSGWLSDAHDRRRVFVFAGYGISSLTRPMLALAASWHMILAARVFDRLGKGIRSSPRDALIADSAEPGYRGKAFGFHRTMDQAGAVAGPLLALPLLTFFENDLRSVFLFAFLPSAVSTLLVLLVRDSRPIAGAPRPRISLRGLGPELNWFLLVSAVFGLGNSSDAFLILRAQQLGFSTRDAVACFALFNAAYVVSAFPAGVLSDRFGHRRVFLAGMFVYALVYAGFALAETSIAVWFLFVIYGVYKGLTDGVSRALLADLAPPHLRGTALGAQAAVVGFTALPASAGAGLLWERLGSPVTFWFGACAALIAALLFAAGPRGRRKS